jgi:DNA-directed RNA polymerase specialized sigma24 family protein
MACPESGAAREVDRFWGRFVEEALGALGVRAQDRDDVAQEVPIAVWRRRDTFDGRPIEAWLGVRYITLKRRERMQAQKRRSESLVGDPDELAAGAGLDPSDRRSWRRIFRRASPESSLLKEFDQALNRQS